MTEFRGPGASDGRMNASGSVGADQRRVLDLAGREIHGGPPCRARMLGIARTVRSIDAARHLLAGRVA
jgi:hypothetical protein